MSEEKQEGLLTVIGKQYGVSADNIRPALKAVWGDLDQNTMVAMCIVANQYGLNPFTNEIYAFRNKKTGKVVPIVGIDGWLRLINEHPQFDGMEVSVSEDGEEATCKIWRKDRKFPTVVTEYKRECFRSDTEPWAKFPLRMLRHKAIEQCARIAFGFSGIYDPDEASTFAEPVKQANREKQVEELTARLQNKLESKQEPEVIDAEFTKEKPLEECTLQEFVDRAKEAVNEMQSRED